MKKQHVQLSEADRTYLKELTKKGKTTARVHNRALALLELDRGQTYVRTGEIVGLTNVTVSTLAKKYEKEGLGCLYDKPRSGRPPEIDGETRAKITALACSTPPEGYGKWSLRLLADKAIELGYCETISHTEVGQILKKTRSSLI